MQTTLRRIPDPVFPANAPAPEQYRYLLQYAALAPSSHNSQPWRFAVQTNAVDVFADPERRLPVADADGREWYASVGCALENLRIAAAHFGFAPAVHRFPSPGDPTHVARVTMRACPIPGSIPYTSDTALFAAIEVRHTNHAPFAPSPVPETVLDRLQREARGLNVSLLTATDSAAHEAVNALVTRADALQFADPEWRQELGEWMGRGVFGTPWFLSKVSQLAVTYLNLSARTAEADTVLLDSAPVLGTLVTETNDPDAYVRAGQAMERIWLRATNLGLSLHPMSQILQVPEVKTLFADRLGLSGTHPVVCFRLGVPGATDDRMTPREAPTVIER